MTVITKKCLKGLAALGAGISMLIGIGVSRGIGIATGFAVDGIARNPEQSQTLIEGLILGNFIILIPFWIAFAVALCLVFIVKKWICTDSATIRELSALGAGIAVLGGIGAGVGIGTAVGAALEGISRQPEAIGLIVQGLLVGIFFTLIPLVGAFIIAICLLKIAKSKCCKINNCYVNKSSSNAKIYDNL